MPASFKLLTGRHKKQLCVLARWEELYYKVDIVKCDKSKGKCLARFDDKAEIWLDIKDLHAQIKCNLDDLEDEDIFCCLCEQGESSAPNVIVICDVCQQGYHQECHIPHIDSAEINNDEVEEEEWSCATCKTIVERSEAKAVPEQNLDLPSPIKKVKVCSSTTSTPKVSLPKKKYTKYSPVVELKNGKTLELMEPEVITAALASNCIDTDKFSTLVCPQSQELKEEPAKPVDKKSRVTKKPIKNSPVPA